MICVGKQGAINFSETTCLENILCKDSSLEYRTSVSYFSLRGNCLLVFQIFARENIWTFRDYIARVARNIFMFVGHEVEFYETARESIWALFLRIYHVRYHKLWRCVSKYFYFSILLYTKDYSYYIILHCIFYRIYSYFTSLYIFILRSNFNSIISFQWQRNLKILRTTHTHNVHIKRFSNSERISLFLERKVFCGNKSIPLLSVCHYFARLSFIRRKPIRIYELHDL